MKAEKKKSKNEVFDPVFWKSLGYFGIFVFVICWFPIIFTKFHTGIDFNLTGQIGETIGGIMGPFIAIAAAGLTFLAFWVQYKANEQQKADILDLKSRAEIEKLETKFFEMIKLHRDNVSELTYTSFKKHLGEKFSSDDNTKEQTAISRKVFRVIYSDFLKINQELSHFFEEINENDIYEEGYLINLKKNIELQKRNINLIQYAKVDILYCIIYFGLSYEDQQTIRFFFKNRYKEIFFESVIQFAALKPKEESEHWRKWTNFRYYDSNIQMSYFETLMDLRKKSSKWDTLDINKQDQLNSLGNINYQNHEKYYGGHQFRLGHYFRHLYQTVTFIDQSALLDYKGKYSNIKLLRGQISTFEQSIFFLNSVSALGRKWELENRETPEIAINPNNQLITKYNLIKNILNDKILDTISVSDFYPLVAYESNFSEKKKIDRERLEKIYS